MTTPADELRTAARRCRSGMLAVHIDFDVPLADWLDVAADLIDSYPDLGRTHIDGEPCTDLACRTVHAALAVARQINGIPR
ncbi:hypothetical protein ACWGDX_13400 [Streptomyces sp. NPDC055025]